MRADLSSTSVDPGIHSLVREDFVLKEFFDRGSGRFRRGTAEYASFLVQLDPELFQALYDAENINVARRVIFNALQQWEDDIFLSEQDDDDIGDLERSHREEAIAVLRHLFSPHNERKAGFSTLEELLSILKSAGHKADVEPGFLLELIYLFRSASRFIDRNLLAHELQGQFSDFLKEHGRTAAQMRTRFLDRWKSVVEAHLNRYVSGLEEPVIERRRKNRQRILEYFGGTEDDWRNWHWHLKHVIRTPDIVAELIELPDDQREIILRMSEGHIPFGITPYYLSLMLPEHLGKGAEDHAIRAQVLPPPDYVSQMVSHAADRSMQFDFMGEHDTSPVNLVTRRYPGIAIFKPFNTCAQICVYCQRNWEINECMAPHALARWDDMEDAIKWFEDHPAVGEVLITGGDPLVMSNRTLERILHRFAEIPHIYRIRIGSRTPVVLPFRLTDELADIMASFHEPGRREIALVTHVEHSYEITREMMEAVQRIRRKGINVYNQQVFTIENSRRFETARLRLDLRRIGIDPYYTFNAKGKAETRSYRVPIARLLQERKEEARLLPGLDRTDEPVFNVPRLGKNHLRASQDRRLIAIHPDGSRIYAFHPWEKGLVSPPVYIHKDVPIHEYLEELHTRGEDVTDYQTIWYYI